MNRFAFVALAFAAVICATPVAASDFEARGRAALEAGDHAAAAKIFEAAVKDEPDNADYHYLLGAAYVAGIDDAGMFGKMRLARGMRKAWERAVEIDPNHAQAHISLFGYYLQAPAIAGGDRDKALAELDQVARIAAQSDDLELVLAHALLRQQVEDWATAAAEFERIVAADESVLMAWYQIGRTALRSGERVERGIEALHHYLTQTPGENDPSLAWAHTRLGQLYATSGRPDEARAHYTAALELEPEHEEAMKAMEAL